MRTKLLCNILVLAGLTLAAAGCRRAEPYTNGPVISFLPTTVDATKTIIDGEVYPITEEFVVSSFYNGTTPYFENKHAVYDDSNGQWKATPHQYWPLEGDLYFRAYSPYGVSGITIGATGFTATDYTIQTNTDLTRDLCFAGSLSYDCSAPQPVALQFSHMLSKVSFRVRAQDYSSTASNLTIYLTSLTLEGVNSVGNYSGSSWSTNTPYSYTLWTGNQELTYDAVSGLPEFIDICSYVFLPQTLHPDNARLVVGYDVIQDEETDSHSISVKLAENARTDSWDVAKKYTYSLSLGVYDNLDLTLDITDWTYHEHTFSGNVQPTMSWSGTRLRVDKDQGYILMDNWSPAHCSFTFGSGDMWMATIIGDEDFTFCMEDGTALTEKVEYPDSDPSSPAYYDKWMTTLIPSEPLSYELDGTPIPATLHIKVTDFTTVAEHEAILRFYLRSREGDWQLVRMTTPEEGWGSDIYEVKLIQNYK